MSARKAAAGDGPYPLPDGWRWVKLGEIATWGSGGTPKRSVPDYFGGSVPWLSISDLNDGSISDSRECLTEAGLENSAAKIVPKGTIFVAMYGSIGKLGVASCPMATSQAIAWAIPNDSIVDRNYLFNFLLSQRSKLQSRGRGGTQSNIGQKDLKDWKMPLAPLSEQRRISEILDSAKIISEDNSKTVSDLQSTVPSLYASRFGKVPLASTVAEVAVQSNGSIRTGPFGSQLKKEEYATQGVSVLGLDNVVGNVFSWGQRRYISSEQYELLKRYTVFPGDVLISIMATTGRCVVVPEDIPVAINTKHICAITANRSIILPEFLRATFLWNPEVRAYLSRQTKGAIMSGLNMGIIKKMPVPVPSMSDQMEFVHQMRSIQHNMDLLAKRAAMYSELFMSLQYRAFRGGL